MAGIVVGISSSIALYSFNTLRAKDTIDCHECRMKRLPKAKELPLYEKDDAFVIEYDEQTKLPFKPEISAVRQSIFGLTSYVSGFKEEISHIVETGVAHTQSSYDYIASEENRIPRILAISSGGFIGYFFARKRGIFRKLLYISTGCGLVFSMFYPTVAKDYISLSWENAKSISSNMLEQYGGYDTKKLADETNEKVEAIKRTMKLEGLTNLLKEWFDKNKEKITETLNITTDAKVTKEKFPENSSKVTST